MLWPKGQEERVGEAEPELGWVLGGQAAVPWGWTPAGRRLPGGQTAHGDPTAAQLFWDGSRLSSMALGRRCLVVGRLESGSQVRRGLEREEVPVIVLLGGWREGVLAVEQHVPCVCGCEGAGLGAKVEEDGIRFPAAQGADGSFFHAGDEESSGSPGAKAVGDDSGGGGCS